MDEGEGLKKKETIYWDDELQMGDLILQCLINNEQ